MIKEDSERGRERKKYHKKRGGEYNYIGRKDGARMKIPGCP